MLGAVVQARLQTGWEAATFSVGYAHQSPCRVMHQDAGSPAIRRPASSAILSCCSPWNNTLVVSALTRMRRDRSESRTLLDVEGRKRGCTCIPAGLCISVHGILACIEHFAAIFPEQACASRMADARERGGLYHNPKQGIPGSSKWVFRKKKESTSD